MIEKTNLAGKSFVTSSQLLESMEFQSTPSRAEIYDVSNAVLDGTDYVMLSSKASNGQYFFNALDQISKCCVEAEKMMDFQVKHYNDETLASMIEDPEAVAEARKTPQWMKDMNRFFEREDFKITTQILDMGFRIKFVESIATASMSGVAQATQPVLQVLHMVPG